MAIRLVVGEVINKKKYNHVHHHQNPCTSSTAGHSQAPSYARFAVTRRRTCMIESVGFFETWLSVQSLLRKLCLRSENNVGQGLRPLGSRIRLVDDLSLFVVDLLALLVAQQQHHSAEQEDGCSPAHSVRPSELPYRAVSCNPTIQTELYSCKALIKILPIDYLRSRIRPCYPIYRSIE